MSNRLRWGLLSTANINDALIDPIRAATRSELVAVASRDLAKGQAYAAEKGIAKAYGSYEAMLADPEIDVVYISLPNSLHCEWTVKAAEAGKHVLCEKPLVTTLADMQTVEAAAQANKVTIFEAFMYLHHPQTLKIQSLIQGGRLGQIQLINSWFNFYLSPEHAQNIRLRPELHGGSLWDVGVYTNSAAIVLANAGAPKSVFATQTIGETGAEVAIQGHLRFHNDVTAQISSSFRTPFREALYVVGDEATLYAPEPWKPGLFGEESRLILTDRDGTVEEIVIPAVNPYLCEVQAMEASVLDGAEPVITLEESRNFLKSVLALYESAQTGQIVQPA